MASAPIDVIPSSIGKLLSDRSYEKRKTAALELEHIVKEKLEQQDHNGIALVLDSLHTDFIKSSNPNYRKGGLIGMAAVSIALHDSSIAFLDAMLLPVLSLLRDKDSRVRYYACEALYNITKIARGHVLNRFNEIFQSLCNLFQDTDKEVFNGAQLLDRLIKDIVTENDHFDTSNFIPLLKSSIKQENPQVRQLVVGWITVLNSVPDIQMLDFLPEFLGGLLDMLSDSSVDICHQSQFALDEFLEDIDVAVKDHQNIPALGSLIGILLEQSKNRDNPDTSRAMALQWVQKFLEIEQKVKVIDLSNHYADIVGAVLSCLFEEDQRIRRKAEDTNAFLLKVCANKGSTLFASKSVIDRILSILLGFLEKSSHDIRISVLEWISMLMETSSVLMKPFFASLCPLLLDILSDPEELVVYKDLTVLSKIAISSEENFDFVLKNLVEKFKLDQEMLETRGHLVIRQLSVLLGSERIYRSISGQLLHEQDTSFISLIVEKLNFILLTSAELFDLRECIKNALQAPIGRDLFTTMFLSWCHNPVAVLSLCLLSQAYELASALVMEFSKINMSVPLLIQIDKLVQLIESPVFVNMRLQLLERSRYPYLLKVLCGLLMLLPQSNAFNALRMRIQSVSFLASMENVPENKFAEPSARLSEKEIQHLLNVFKQVHVNHKLSA